MGNNKSKQTEQKEPEIDYPKTIEELVNKLVPEEERPDKITHQNLVQFLDSAVDSIYSIEKGDPTSLKNIILKCLSGGTFAIGGQLAWKTGPHVFTLPQIIAGIFTGGLSTGAATGIIISCFGVAAINVIAAWLLSRYLKKNIEKELGILKDVEKQYQQLYHQVFKTIYEVVQFIENNKYEMDAFKTTYMFDKLQNKQKEIYDLMVTMEKHIKRLKRKIFWSKVGKIACFVFGGTLVTTGFALTVLATVSVPIVGHAVGMSVISAGGGLLTVGSILKCYEKQYEEIIKHYQKMIKSLGQISFLLQNLCQLKTDVLMMKGEEIESRIKKFYQEKSWSKRYPGFDKIFYDNIDYLDLNCYSGVQDITEQEFVEKFLKDDNVINDSFKIDKIRRMTWKFIDGMKETVEAIEKKRKACAKHLTEDVLKKMEEIGRNSISRQDVNNQIVKIVN